MNVRMLAAAQLTYLVDQRVNGLLRTYRDVFTDSELIEAKSIGSWLTIRTAIDRLSKKNVGKFYQHTLNSLAADTLRRELNNCLTSLCRDELTEVIPSVGRVAVGAFVKYSEGLISENELLSNLVDALSLNVNEVDNGTGNFVQTCL